MEYGLRISTQPQPCNRKKPSEQCGGQLGTTNYVFKAEADENMNAKSTVSPFPRTDTNVPKTDEKTPENDEILKKTISIETPLGVVRRSSCNLNEPMSLSNHDFPDIRLDIKRSRSRQLSMPIINEAVFDDKNSEDNVGKIEEKLEEESDEQETKENVELPPSKSADNESETISNKVIKDSRTSLQPVEETQQKTAVKFVSCFDCIFVCTQAEDGPKRVVK